MSLNLVDQQVKRKFSVDAKLKSFWLNDVEKAKTETETISILIRELNRIEELVGVTSVILILNVALTAALLVAVLLMMAGTGVDASQASKAMGIAKGIIGGAK
jgi:hypothetical protein